MLPAIDLQLEDDITDSSPGAGQPFVSGQRQRRAQRHRSKRFPHDPDRQRTDHLQRARRRELTVTARRQQHHRRRATPATSFTRSSPAATPRAAAPSSGLNGNAARRPTRRVSSCTIRSWTVSRPPTESGYTADWTLIDDPGSHAALTYDYDLSPAVRASAILFTVDKCQTTPRGHA